MRQQIFDCDTLDFCILLIPQTLDQCWNSKLALAEANSDIKGYTWPLLPRGRSIIQGAKFWQDGTVAELQFSILFFGGMKESLQFAMTTLSVRSVELKPWPPPSAGWDYLLRCRNSFRYSGDEDRIKGKFFSLLMLPFQDIFLGMVILRWKTELLSLLYLANNTQNL